MDVFLDSIGRALILMFAPLAIKELAEIVMRYIPEGNIKSALKTKLY
jgi:hypothetical protein